MKGVRKVFQVLFAILLVAGFALCVLAALMEEPSRRGGVILLRVR